MEDLTFGEQVKIILGRKGMTIKELAEIIEERTGKKMSRQNLTQRLGRDNFQEQDMRTIANILGCPFHLSILSRETPAAATAVTESGESVPTEKEWRKLEKKRQQKAAERKQAFTPVKGLQDSEDILDEDDAEDIEETAPDAGLTGAIEAESAEGRAAGTAVAAESAIGDESETEEVDMTIGELYEIHEELSELEENVQAGEPIETIKEELEQKKEVKTEKKEKFRTGGIFLRKKGNPAPAEESVLQKEEKTAPPVQDEEEPEDFEPVIKHDDVEEDRELGEVNPYTGREYQSNSVRMHPSRIGYVQVYDRSTHKWTDMTEWAFLGYQERKKALLGKEYEPPIYLD
ncbi:hypothetical protein GCM10008922_21210 [Faecalicatena contorta]|uniref:hypothetical protein n=1 Tax=Faecalicatena contorta TaxID=39482 RepID=UPI0031DAE128